MIVVISFTSAEFVNANSSTADTLRSPAPEMTLDEDRMEEILLYGLSSDVDGIVEATFYNTVAYKTMNPEFNSEMVEERIAEIALDKKSHVVRYKAFLTLSYLKDYDEFAEENEKIRSYVQSHDETSAFQVIVDKLRKQQVASN
jgi:hypothetical protein